MSTVRDAVKKFQDSDGAEIPVNDGAGRGYGKRDLLSLETAHHLARFLEKRRAPDEEERFR